MIGTKTSLILCLVPFFILLGVCKLILLGLWCMRGSVARFFYECWMVIPNPTCDFYAMHHPSVNILLLFGSWSIPLWIFMIALLTIRRSWIFILINCWCDNHQQSFYSCIWYFNPSQCIRVIGISCQWSDMLYDVMNLYTDFIH